MSELEDLLSILRMQLEEPNNLGKKRFMKLQIEGYRLLSSPSHDLDYLARVQTINQELFAARKRKHGGQIGIKDQYHFENDRIVFERMVAGETQAAAIKSVYGDDTSGTHKKRIKRRKDQIEEMAMLSAETGDIEPPGI